MDDDVNYYVQLNLGLLPGEKITPQQEQQALQLQQEFEEQQKKRKEYRDNLLKMKWTKQDLAKLDL